MHFQCTAVSSLVVHSCPCVGWFLWYSQCHQGAPLAVFQSQTWDFKMGQSVFCGCLHSRPSSRGTREKATDGLPLFEYQRESSCSLELQRSVVPARHALRVPQPGKRRKKKKRRNTSHGNPLLSSPTRESLEPGVSQKPVGGMYYSSWPCYSSDALSGLSGRGCTQCHRD